MAAPVLVLVGEFDGGPRPEPARTAADELPKAEFTVQPGAGRCPWVDDPGWFAGRVAGFLDRDGPLLPSAE
ncbi:alpha/beta fold hydrolase [Streptomyces sp. NPDC001401]|uniref:alpha/beta fold hydrolase n=1 Tax=Streptomyces sp. NPDC001401 TaxID=3364570 RepID=UPI003688802F